MYFFSLNNKKIFTSRNFTVSEFLDFLFLDLSNIVIEYNGLVLPKQLWFKTFLQPNDKLEFVTIVGGG